MLVIRDIFRCKPGKAKELADRFHRVLPIIEKLDGFRRSRVLVDYVATYWTVVLEGEIEDLSYFDAHMAEWGKRPEVQEIMKGYMDLVEGGHREIFRVVS